MRLDRIIELKKKDRLKINIIMQVDTVSYKIPNFVTKATAAGCRKVFIGLENINPESLKSASKAWDAPCSQTDLELCLCKPPGVGGSLNQDSWKSR